MLRGVLTADGSTKPIASVKPIIRPREPGPPVSPTSKNGERPLNPSRCDAVPRSTADVSQTALPVCEKKASSCAADLTRGPPSVVDVGVKTSPLSLPSSTRHQSRRVEPTLPPPSSNNQLFPDGYMRVASCVQPSSEADEARLKSNCHQLEQSTFYVGEMTSNDAKECLRKYPVGTFLVRNSAHPRYLYSLSVKTRRGVTSIRLAYDLNGFSLDADPDQAPMMRAFDTVVELVAHYVAEGRRVTALGAGTSCVFMERSGRRDLPVLLSAPYLGGCGGKTATFGVSSLCHLSRIAINSSLAGRSADRLVISPSLKIYLKDYPYGV